MRPVRDFLEERTGLPGALDRWLSEPATPRLADLGGVLVALLALQAATGFALSLHYAPTATDAWGSVWFIENRLLLGGLIRGLHHWGTSAIVVAAGLHLLQMALTASYRRPRELLWWTGLALLGVILAFAMTGNPLPWDQRGFWGARVESQVMGTIPVLGPLLQRLFLGGNDLGNLTLTRFHALHTIALPAVLLAVLGIRFALARRHGEIVAPGKAGTRQEQLVLTLGVSLGVFALVLGLALWSPPLLEAPAEPASSYQAEPAWYFLPLNQLLSLFPGDLQVLATAVIPGLATLFLVALPFLDRGPAREVSARIPWVGGVGAGGLGVVALLVLGLQHGAELELPRAKARKEADRAVLVAAQGLPAEGAAAMMAHDPLTRGERLFVRHCQPCHLVGGEGTDEPNGPDLAGYLSAPWLRALIEQPRDPRFFGTTKIDLMDPYAEEEPAELAAVVELLRGVRNHPGVEPDALPFQAGVTAYGDMGCDQCHELAPEVEGSAPNLAGYGSDAWLKAFLEDPGGALFYGDENDMPAFDEKLTEEDLDAVIVYLRTLEPLPLAPVQAQAAR